MLRCPQAAVSAATSGGMNVVGGRRGWVSLQEGRYEAALAEFERALTLPGTGVKQFTNKPALISDGAWPKKLLNCCSCGARLVENDSGLKGRSVPAPVLR